MDFLKLTNTNILVTGAFNKKSIATFVSKTLLEVGANPIFSVQNEEVREKIQKIFPESKIYICDVEKYEDIKQLGIQLSQANIKLSGMVHSMAFANFEKGMRPFHETDRDDFKQATQISCFSLTELSESLKEFFLQDASVVALSISSTRATSYGYLGPIKATLEASVPFLAKSFSAFSKVRFNCVCAGPLKTSASAGIPNYVENFLYAEKLMLRKEALKTQEVADTVCYLLSNRSSGINASNITVDGGMSCNYFDQDVVL